MEISCAMMMILYPMEKPTLMEQNANFLANLDGYQILGIASHKSNATMGPGKTSSLV